MCALQGNDNCIHHRTRHGEYCFPPSRGRGVQHKLEEHQHLEYWHVPSANPSEQWDIDVEDEEEVDQAGREVARSPDKAETSRGPAPPVLDKLWKQDEKPDGVARIPTDVRQDAKPLGQVGIAVFLQAHARYLFGDKEFSNRGLFDEGQRHNWAAS